MRSRMFVLLVFIALIVSPIKFTAAQDQEQEPEGRGGALWERPKKQVPAPQPNSPHQQLKTHSAPLSQPTSVPEPAPKPAATGLGYTLYRHAEDGRAVRVDPSHVFQSGDEVRFVFEPNIDGYLYIFNSDSKNESDPRMIFPSWRLFGGTNSVRAFVPVEIPSSHDPNPQRQWFVMHGDPATEHYYIVMSRHPLPGVPIGEDLVKYCQANQDGCPWRPISSVWTQVQLDIQVKVTMAKSRDYGQEQTQIEKEAIARQTDLPEDAPKPSVVYKNTSPDRDVIVSVIDLVHK